MLAFKRHSYILEMQKLEIGLVLKCFENHIIRVSGSEYVFLTKKILFERYLFFEGYVRCCIDV